MMDSCSGQCTHCLLSVRDSFTVICSSCNRRSILTRFTNVIHALSAVSLDRGVLCLSSREGKVFIGHTNVLSTAWSFTLKPLSCGAGWSSSTLDMKSESLQNFITTVFFRSGDLENGQVVGDTVGKFYRLCEVVPEGPTYNSETDIVVTTGKSRKEIHLDGDLTKRKYEDMTSSRIEDVDAGNDHEVSLKLSHFREQMKRRPPEAGNLMQVQATTTVQVEAGAFGEDELQARSDSRRRSRSASGVEVTPDICGESDLTAENHMAEETSRSSNNDGSSMFESAAESVSKGSTKELRSVSSLGDMHCFMVHANGGRDISTVKSSQGPSHMSNLLVRNDGHNITRTEMKDVQHQEGEPKSEPVASIQLVSASTEAPGSSGNTGPSQLWGRSNKEWLQLGVGSSGINSNSQSEPVSGEEGKPSPAGHGHQDRAFFKRKNTTSIDFPIAADCEANSNFFPESSNVNMTRGERQFRRASNLIPLNCEASSDPPVNLNPANVRSVPISGLMKNVAASEAANVEIPDLCIFGRRLIQTGTARQELVLAPLNGSGARQSCSDASGKDRASVSRDSSFEMRRDQEDLQSGIFYHSDERLCNASLRMSENYSRPGPPFSSMSTPSMDVQVRSARASAAGTSMDQDPFQCHRDNSPSSLSALQQRREDLRHGQVGYSWLPPPAAESVPKLIPMANNFQGWTSSELTSTMKSAALSASAMENPLDQQAMRCSDEWGSLYRKVSPKMIFQSQCHLPEGPSGLVQSAGQETNAGSQENLVALKRTIENIKRPQWPIPPEAMNLSVASWCLNGNLQGVRGDSKPQCFAGDRSLMSSILSESSPVHSRFPGDHLNLGEKAPQRQSWQQAAGHMKLHHGSVNAVQRPSPETAGKPKFEVLPPGSKGTNHAGLWFILQSADNQNNEGDLPQISKAYLRIKDGKMPVSAVKKYLVTKLGLTNESEVEITCKGQPVVPSLPLQHVRDVIWFSSLNANNNSSNREQTSSGEKEESRTSASEQRSRPPPATDRATAAAGIFSKDILMVLTYRRHPRSLQGSTLLT